MYNLHDRNNIKKLNITLPVETYVVKKKIIEIFQFKGKGIALRYNQEKVFMNAKGRGVNRLPGGVAFRR